MLLCCSLLDADVYKRERGVTRMGKKLFAIAFCAAALLGVSATGALAGEVKGPPTGGTPNTE